MPLTSFGIVLGGLSLIGVPGTAGFISKWHLILAAMEKGQWWLVGAIVFSSLFAVAYVWRFVEVAYFQSAPDDPQDACRSAVVVTDSGMAADPGHALVRAGFLLAAGLGGSKPRSSCWVARDESSIP